MPTNPLGINNLTRTLMALSVTPQVESWTSSSDILPFSLLPYVIGSITSQQDATADQISHNILFFWRNDGSGPPVLSSLRCIVCESPDIVSKLRAVYIGMRYTKTQIVLYHEVPRHHKVMNVSIGDPVIPWSCS